MPWRFLALLFDLRAVDELIWPAGQPELQVAAATARIRDMPIWKGSNTQETQEPEEAQVPGSREGTGDGIEAAVVSAAELTVKLFDQPSKAGVYEKTACEAEKPGCAVQQSEELTPIWHACVMEDQKQQPESEPASFMATAVVGSGFTEFLFAHSGGTAIDAEVRFGIVKDGRSTSGGDGGSPVTTAGDLRVVLFDLDCVDASTVHADSKIGVRTGSDVDLLLTWRSKSDPQKVFARGLRAQKLHTEQFAMSETLEDHDALRSMADRGGIREEDVAPIVVAEPDASHFVELSVSGYRGFADERSLQLAEPNGAEGSGLTVLVGANNSGKSTFLEALHAIARARQQSELSFSQPRRHRDKDAVAIKLVRSDGRQLKVESIRPGSSQAEATWLPVDGGPDKFDIHVTPSRRQFTPYFGSMGTPGRDWGLMDQEFSRTQLREQFVGRLRAVDKDAIARGAFDSLLKEIIGSKLDWTIDEIATNQQFLKLIEPDGAWHTSEGLGDGLVSLLFLVDALYDSSPGSLIAIDEPELSLHPQLVRRLGRVLARFARDRQIVVATHSPLVLDWADVANGAAVARVYKSDGRSEVAQASEATLKKVANLADTRNVKNPHTVGSVAREAFFLEDGVILMEGQDDVAYLPRILADLGLPRTENVYGWGSGGAGNTPLLAQLFLELGFSHVGVILDDDSQPGTISALEKLEAMGPRVLVRQVPAPDIRYKEGVEGRQEVLGVLDNDNKHVRAELRELTAERLRDILDHVSPRPPLEP